MYPPQQQLQQQLPSPNSGSPFGSPNMQQYQPQQLQIPHPSQHSYPSTPTGVMTPNQQQPMLQSSMQGGMPMQGGQPIQGGMMSPQGVLPMQGGMMSPQGGLPMQGGVMTSQGGMPMQAGGQLLPPLQNPPMMQGQMMAPQQQMQMQANEQQMLVPMQQHPMTAQQQMAMHANGGVPPLDVFQMPVLPIKVSLPGPFRTGICGCFSDVKVCCCGSWCIPCLYADNHARIYGSGYCMHCLLYALLPCCACIYASKPRQAVRVRYNLHEEPCSDCFMHCFCSPCAVCQEARELKLRG